MSERGVYPRSQGHGTLIDSRDRSALVGNVLYHTIGDREEALELLRRDVGVLRQELKVAILHATPEHPDGLASDVASGRINPAHFFWWQQRAVPFFNDFIAWSAARSPVNWTRFGSYVALGEQFTTDWDTYKMWRDRLADLRQEAISAGIRVKAVEPTKLPTTVIEEAAEAAKRLGRQALGFGNYVKYMVIAALGVAGIALISGAARER